MPTSPFKARMFLRTGKAKVVHRTPSVIRFPHNSSTHTQPLTPGVDAGSSVLRSAGIDEDGKLRHASEVMVRNAIADRMKRRHTSRPSSLPRQASLPRAALRLP
ncbi:MAG TPA: RRXRR domain-containing protein [Terracidiphilus sp.]